MDVCNVCGVAVDVRLDNLGVVYICRNPQCPQFGQILNHTTKEGDINVG